MSAKNYRNHVVYVKIIASQRWDVFETQCINVQSVAEVVIRRARVHLPAGRYLIAQDARDDQSSCPQL